MVIPELETEERPESLPIIRAARPVFLEQSPDEGGIEEALTFQLALRESPVQGGA